MADDAPTPPTSIDINYQKSSTFREVGCDGVLGGPTPQGNFWIAFYTERFPLPRVVRQAIIQGPEEHQFKIDPNDPGTPLESKQGILRNVEFGVYLTPDTMQQLYDWLGKALEESKNTRVS